jgi:hypothetical protein
VDLTLLDTVVVKHDLPEYRLRAGDAGAIVEVHDPDFFEVEFVTASGKTHALVTLRTAQVRKAGNRDLLAVRALSDDPPAAGAGNR